MAAEKCPEHERLTENALKHLKKLNGLTSKQLEAFEAEDHQRFMELDHEVELALGEKERLIGALRQHDEEHGCQQNTFPEE